MWVQEGSALRSLGLSFQGKKHLRKTSGFLPLWVEYWALISLIWRPWYPDLGPLGPWLLESVLGSAGNVPWPPGRRYYWAIPCQLIPQIKARLPGCLLDPGDYIKHQAPKLAISLKSAQAIHGRSRLSLKKKKNMQANVDPCWKKGPWRRQCHWTSCKSSELLQRTHDPRKALQTGSLKRIIWPVKPCQAPFKRSPEPPADISGYTKYTIHCYWDLIGNHLLQNWLNSSKIF